MRSVARSLAFSLLVLSAACGASTGSRAPRGDPDVLTQAELEPLIGITARQAIDRLRPRFLRTRGPTSIMNASADRIVVYVDNTRMGSVEVLDQIQVFEVREIRYLNAADATNRYGTGHAAGAIIVQRR